MFAVFQGPSAAFLSLWITMLTGVLLGLVVSCAFLLLRVRALQRRTADNLKEGQRLIDEAQKAHDESREMFGTGGFAVAACQRKPS